VKKKYQLIGKRFTRLKVINSHPKKSNGQTQWLCLCDCGKKLIVTTSDLNSKGVQSCGCLNRDNVRKRCLRHGYANRKNIHPLYNTWVGMNGRCLNEKHAAYKYYGARGISVCKDWQKNPEKFIDWAQENGWKPGLTIERVDNNKGYSPSNCKISTMMEQLQNTRRTKRISFKGKTLTLREWEEETGIKKDALYSRIFKLKWSIKKALTTPTKRRLENCYD
jgi:hypothetical protein